MSKLSTLTATTAPAAGDLLYVVINPSTTPAERKVTVDNLFKSRTGNNSVLAYASLAAAVSAIGSSQAVIEIPATTSVSADLTVPSNIEILPTGTGLLSVSSGKTLTYNGPTNRWPARQIFSGSGTALTPGADKANPKWWGAAGNGRHVDDGAMTSSSATLTSATAAFTSSDVGRSVSIKGAGSGGATLITTISGFTNSTTVTLAASASTTVSGKRVVLGSNDTAAFAAWAACQAKSLWVPEGNFVVRMTASGGGAVTVPANTSIFGDGPGSVVYCIGSDGKAGGGADDDNRAAFNVTGSNVRFSSIRFIGENGPFDFVLNNGSNVIWINTTVDNVTIDHCEFDDLFGHPIHELAGSTRVHATHNYVRYCANGININADFSDQSHNHIYHSEGFEASGAYSSISYNLIEFPYVAGISLGGRTGVGDTGPGTVCIGNVIKDSQGGGITANDGFIKGLIADNTIINCPLQGIHLISGGSNDVSDNEISNNVLVNVGSTGSGPVGIHLDGSADRTRVINNRVQTVWIGIRVESGADGVVVRGNRTDGGVSDLYLDDVTNMRLGDNELVNSVFTLSGTGATFKEVAQKLTGTPTTITSNQNDYSPEVFDVLRLSSDASRNITGFKYGATFRVITIVNVGSQNIVLKNQDSGSSAVNRIITGTGADVTFAPDGIKRLMYDGTTQRWRLL